MPLTININRHLTLVHQQSGGVSKATLPDVCKTPPQPTPVPYQNVSFSVDLAKGTKTVFADGGNSCANLGSEFAKSQFDEPGVAGGVLSGVNMRESTWLTYSSDVKLEGKNACRLSDKKFHNHMNTANIAGCENPRLTVEAIDLVCEKCAGVAEKLAQQKQYEIDMYSTSSSEGEFIKKVRAFTNADERGLSYDPAASTGWNNRVTSTCPTTTFPGPPDPSDPCSTLIRNSVIVHENVHIADLEAGDLDSWPSNQFPGEWQRRVNSEVRAREEQIKYLKSFFKDNCGKTITVLE